MANAMTEVVRSAPPEFLFGVLGPLHVRRAGLPVSLGGRQQRAVLARLLVEPKRAVSVEQLADALWGERTPAGAVTTIQTYVSHLRDVLEPSRPRGSPPRVLVTEQRGYRLDVATGSIDSEQFELAVASGRAMLEKGRHEAASVQLRDALALWRGEVLDDLAEYDFVREFAAHLDALRLSAIEDRIEADLALGRHQQLVGELDELVAVHPLRERLHGQRMLALYRCGQQAEALAAYVTVRDTLAGELGIDPNAALQSRYLTILRQDPELDWHPAAEPDPSPPEGADSRAPAPGAPRRRLRRPLLVALAAASAVVVLAAVGAVVIASDDSGSRSPVRLAANSVGRIGGTGALDRAVRVGQSPAGIAYGHAALWVTNEGDRTVSRVDPRAGRVVQAVDVGAAPNAVAVTGDDVWVVNGGDGTVSRVNARTNRVVQTIKVGNLPSAIAGAAGGVWVANTADDTVQRIDPRTGSAGRPVDVGGRPAGVAVADGTVWVTNARDATVSRVDAATGRVDSPITVGAGPRGLAVTRDAVWVTNSLALSVSRIDRATGQVVAVVGTGDGPRSAVAGAGGVWVSDEFDGTLDRIDPRTNRVDRRVRLGASTRGLAVGSSSVWVAAGSSTAAHRGGTIRVETDVVPGFDVIEPAQSYLPSTRMPYDGLVAQRRTGGVEGTTLVPDLAVSLPHPTDGGRTYSFTVRRGIHYSDGREVRPSDLRRGVVRALGAGQQYYLGILGAHACFHRPGACDLRRGVVTDDAAYRVTFHLARPDPDFLAKLSVFVFATPRDAPAKESATPAPATGPYMIVDHTEANRRRRLTMVRNPHFHQWSFAAKPDGYADRIEWRQVGSPRRRAADIISGRADLTDPFMSSFPTGMVDDLAREQPARLHADSLSGTAYAWLDARTRPFDDVRVRRAVNLAVDRNRLVALWQGPTKMVARCQVFPPNSPGFHPYCPYTRRVTGDGGYHGPDLRAARALVAASGTSGTTVAVSVSDFPEEEAAADRYLGGVLRSLGYRVRDAAPAARPPRAQVGTAWWGPDFPTPLSAWAPVLSCAAVRPPELSLNHGRFCDRQVDALGRRALAAQATDPARARRLWARVDRELTDQAPWVVVATTRWITLVSDRLGNYQSHPMAGPLVDQMWVR